MSGHGTIRQGYLHLLSFALAAMGIISLVGFLQITQPDRHNVVLLPDSALTAIFIGIAFLATAHERRWLRRGACTLAVTVLGYSILHNLLAGSADNGLSLLSGFLRMRTPLAVLLLMVVLGIMAGTGPRPARRLALLLAALCTGYGLLAQLAMWNPALSVFPAGFKPASALIANLFLVLLGLGVAALASGPLARTQAPDALTMVAGACGALLTCSAWYLASAQSADAISRESSLLRQRTAAAITRHFDSRVAMLARLQERWTRGQQPHELTDWELEAQAYVRDHSDIGLIALLDAAGQPHRHTGRRGALPPALPPLLARDTVQHFLAEARRRPRPSVSAVQDLDGRPLQLMATPLPLPGGEVWLMLAVVDTTDLLSPLIQHNLRGVALELRSGNEQTVLGRQDGGAPYLVTGSTDIALANGPRWQLVSGIDTPQTLLGLTYLPALIMAGGLALTFLLMLCQHLAWVAMGRAREEKRARRALELSLGTQRQVQELNQRIMELSQDILCTLDRNGRILDISPSCQTIFGQSRQALSGQRLIDHIHPEDRQATLEHSRRVVRGTPVRGFQSRLLLQDGRSASMLWSAAWSGHDQLMLVSGHDISELMRERDMAAAQQDSLEHIAAAAPLADTLAACCRLAERLLPGARVVIGHAVTADDHTETVSRSATQPDDAAELHGLLQQLLAAPAQAETPGNDSPLQLLPLASRGNERIGGMLIHDSARAADDLQRRQALARVSHLAAIAIERLRDRQQLAHSEQHFRSLYDANPDAIFFLDHAGRLRDMNDSACALMGWERARDAGRNSEDLLPVPVADWVLSQIAQGGDCQPARFDQTVYIAPRRCMLHLDVSAFPVRSGTALHGVFCLAKDVTAQRNAIDELHLYRRCLESSYNGVIIADARQPDLPIVYVNPAFERITGYSRREAQGRNCRFLQGSDTTQEALEELRRGLVEGRDIHVIVRNFRKDGTQFWNDLYITPIRNEKGEITHFAGVQNDISEKRRYENQISFSSSHDVLTGLPNRTLLEDRLRQGCQFSRRYRRSLAVIYVDLDGFKPVNDSLGHLSGDELLKEAGRRLQEQVRPGDTVARMGADEFILLLPDLACEEDVIPVIERVSRSLRQPFRLQGNEIHLSASIGISCSDGSIDDPLQLIQQADLAMYKAKQEGKNNYQWYTNDLNQKVSERLALRNLIQVALDGDEFRLRFQPQIEGRSGRIIGLEAQVSWMSSDDSMLPAGDFLPIAEETGQIIPISQWMLDTTCDCIRRLRARNISVPVFGIRISPVHFQRGHFVQDLVRCLGRHGVEAADIELEIRETTLLQGREQTIDKLNELKRLGFRLAIDNFGTGFSSLGHLKTLPVDKVKLDRSLIREVISDRHDAAMMQAIISIAHHLDLRVAADGVDTEPQFSFLVKNMCDEFQGSYFSPAMSFELVESLLASKSHLRNPEPLSGEGHKPTVLLLDDEENILRALTRVLRRDGYQILTAQRARDAFDLLARNEVQVIISDQRMPDMSGTDFLSQVKDIYPETIRIVLSGFTDLKSVTDAINQGAIYRFLTKPWDDDELRQHVAEAFRRHAAGQRNN